MLVVSGTKIADEIGTGRSEVWRLIQQLRELGVEIAGHPATGYRLEAVPDLLLPDILDPLLRGTMFAGRLHHFFRTGSTNAVAMQAAAQGEPEGAAFLAEEQTAGRGRGGHSWESQASVGVYASMVFRPPLAPAKPSSAFGCARRPRPPGPKGRARRARRWSRRRRRAVAPRLRGREPSAKARQRAPSAKAPMRRNFSYRCWRRTSRGRRSSSARWRRRASARFWAVRS